MNLGNEKNYFDAGGYRVALKPCRLLLVDDDPDVLAHLEKIVQSVGGFEPPYKASSYSDALLLIDSCEFDLLICDYNLGLGNGLDVILRAKDRWKGLKSVLLTAHDETHVLTSALKSGVDHYIHKPCDRMEVRQTLKLLRDGLTRQKALVDALSQYSSLVHAIPDIVYKIDERGIIVFINKAVESLGYQQEELLGQHIRVLIHPDDFQRCHSQSVLDYYKAVSTGDMGAPKLLDERRSGDRMTKNLYLRILSKENRSSSALGEGIEVSVNAYGEVSSTGVHSSKGENSFFVGTVGIIRDISVRRRYEREMIQNRLQLEEALRAKDEFLTNVSHETRTPMNSILGMAELLSQTKCTEEQKNYLKAMSSGAANLKVILDDVLALSESKGGKVVVRSQKFKLMDVIEPLREVFLKDAEEKGLALTFELRNSECRVQGDLSLLQQVLSKLLSNALKFTESGSISVTLSIREKESVQNVRYSELLLRVVDTGIGVAEGLHEKIFEPFTQGDGSATRQYGGTGIGLALCRELTELMGGDIGVHSVPGQGSSFQVSVPVDLLVGKEGEGESIQEVHLEKLNIFMLVIMGDLGAGQRVMRLLKHYGVDGRLVTEPGAAIKAFMVLPVKGVFFSDEMLLQNKVLLGELRKFYRENNRLPVFVILTRYSEADFEGMGIAGFLTSSFRSVEVIPVLEEWRSVLEWSSHSNDEEDLLSEFGLGID